MFGFSTSAAEAAHLHCLAPHQILIQASRWNEEGTHQVLAWSLENYSLGVCDSLATLPKMFGFSTSAAGAAHLHCWAPHQILIQASRGNEEGTHQVLAWSLENSRLGECNETHLSPVYNFTPQPPGLRM